MVSLHFICPEGLNHRKIGQTHFESGKWVVSDARAAEAIGGRLYLHAHQNTAAWHGGTIVDWREDSGKKIFVYKVEGDYAVICPGGWGQEQATVRS